MTVLAVTGYAELFLRGREAVFCRDVDLGGFWGSTPEALAIPAGIPMSFNTTRTILAIYVLAISVLLAIAAAEVVLQIPIPMFTKDVTAIAEIHPLSGILSNIGIYLWCISATASFFAAMVLRVLGRTKIVSFLFNSAFLSTYLMLDDAFLFHEFMAPEFLGISENLAIMTLGIAVLVYVKSFLPVILKTDRIVFIAALTFLSSSVALDFILKTWFQQIGQWEFLIEDGAKWLGIVSWCIYHVRTAFSFVVRACDQCSRLNAWEQ